MIVLSPSDVVGHQVISVLRGKEAVQDGVSVMWGFVALDNGIIIDLQESNESQVSCYESQSIDAHVDVALSRIVESKTVSGVVWSECFPCIGIEVEGSLIVTVGSPTPYVVEPIVVEVGKVYDRSDFRSLC